MPKAALCPNCGGPLSETSVVALAPVCEHCKAVITETGGTLGLTSVYGVNDPTITERRVEADLAVFCDYRNKYAGMLEACKEQLTWGVERYAKLPPQPELLELKPVPSLLCILGWEPESEFRPGCTAFFLLAVISALISSLIYDSLDSRFWRVMFDSVRALSRLAVILSSPFYLGTLLVGLVSFAMATAANGKRPLENARRQKAYESARAAALKAAEPVKAAQDHRLRVQICELEGLIKTVTAKADEVRGILRTLAN